MFRNPNPFTMAGNDVHDDWNRHYDSMSRLLNSTLNGATNLTLTYDATGNINSKSDVSASHYAYDTVHRHAVKTAGSWSIAYSGRS